MEISTMSATSVKMFEQCPYKFKLNYSERQPQKKSIPLLLGTVVHEVLYEVVERLKKTDSYPQEVDYRFADDVYIKTSAECGLSDNKALKDGLIMIYDFMSMYNPTEKVIDLENKFKIDMGNFKLVGAMDKVVELNKDTIGIIDYKTSWVLPTADQVNSDMQMSIYDLAASILYPSYSKRVLMLNMLRKGNRLVTYREDFERRQLETYLQHLYDTITEMGDEEFVAVPNTYCGWCDFKNKCGEYAKILESAEWSVKPPETLTDGELVKEWETHLIRKKITADRENSLKMVLSERVRGANGKLYGEDGKFITTQQSSLTSYDVGGVLNVVPQDDWFSVISINKTALRRYMIKRNDLRGQIENASKVSYSQPAFKVKKD